MIGVDVVYIPRVEKILARRREAFLRYISEGNEYEGLRKKTAAGIAARFAAKEAMAKALGTGIARAGLKNLKVRYTAAGAPYGVWKDRLFALSLSHEKDYAVAVARLRNRTVPRIDPEMARLLPAIHTDDHKGDRGKVLVIGGSLGMYGSAEFSARAALRAGCGLSYLAVPDACMRDFALRAREVIVKGQSDLSILNEADAVAIGPGMGRDESAGALLASVLSKDVPMVVDADGLYHLAQARPAEKRDDRIYTPHAAEAARLIDRDSRWVAAHPESAADLFLARYGGILVLKGPRTLIAREGERAVNATGNPGMATAGSGDVLTGIITSFLAQGADGFTACRLGVYMHGLAGDVAARHKGMRSLIASDIIEYLPEAFVLSEADSGVESHT